VCVGRCAFPCNLVVMGSSFLCLQQFQLVSGAANIGGSPQVVQISQGQGGQRLAVPLKLLLQPQVGHFLTSVLCHCDVLSCYYFF